MKVIEFFKDQIRKQDGEVGIEIEVEGSNLNPFPASWWRTHHDGSLRGESMEYVLTNPISRSDIGTALVFLKKFWKDTGAKIDRDTNRTGTHAHINVQDFTFEECITFFCLYAIFEDLIVKFCGKTREGNLFCLRIRDAEYLINYVSNIAITGQWGRLLNDKIRYASVNLSAIPKYGSIEFRSMKGDDNIELIKVWIDMLLRIKDQSKQFKHPSDIVYALSLNGDEAFLQQIMGPYAEDLMCPNMGKLIRDGVRRIQDLAHVKIKKIQARNRLKDEPDVIEAQWGMPEPVRPADVFNYVFREGPIDMVRADIGAIRRNRVRRPDAADEPEAFDPEVAEIIADMQADWEAEQE